MGDRLNKLSILLIKLVTNYHPTDIGGMMSMVILDKYLGEVGSIAIAIFLRWFSRWAGSKGQSTVARRGDSGILEAKSAPHQVFCVI